LCLSREVGMSDIKYRIKLYSDIRYNVGLRSLSPISKVPISGTVRYRWSRYRTKCPPMQTSHYTIQQTNHKTIHQQPTKILSKIRPPKSSTIQFPSPFIKPFFHHPRLSNCSSNHLYSNILRETRKICHRYLARYAARVRGVSPALFSMLIAAPHSTTWR
jgi:hypothetical protein